MTNPVLVVAPFGRDAEMLCRVLARFGVEVRACRDVVEMCVRFDESPAPLIVAEEALREPGAVLALREAVAAQEPWSDVPLILLCHAGEGEIVAPRLRGALEHANVTLVERPVRVRVLVSAVKSAIRAQARQVEVRELLRDLEEANRVKDEFLAIVSHELRTPLNAILGWSSMLRTGAFDRSQLGHGVETIERNARAQARLIDDLLDVSRIVSGKLRLDIAAVDPRDVVTLALETVRPAANARGVSLTLHAAESIGSVMADATRLQQIAWNLMSNAVKFTPRGGRVEVHLTRDSDAFELRVTDTGEGIGADFLPFVFDRFRQRDASTTRTHGGLGLGLAIVKHLVELHGGTARVESKGRDQGATFVVRLPAATCAERARPTERTVSATAAPDEALPSIAGARVLVIDDHADARDMVKRLLEDAGAAVRAEPSVARGLAAIDAFRPTHVVADIGMPGDDGYAFVRKLRARPSEQGGRLPAIALTAYARAEDRERALTAGYDEHVSKPLKVAALFAAIAGAKEHAP